MTDETPKTELVQDPVSGAVVPAHPVGEETALRLTLTTPLYRGATIAMFLSGLGFSAAAPQIASFLVNDLGASLTVAGLYYLTALTAPVTGDPPGKRSPASSLSSPSSRDSMLSLRHAMCAGHCRGSGRTAGWSGLRFTTQDQTLAASPPNRMRMRKSRKSKSAPATALAARPT